MCFSPDAVMEWALLWHYMRIIEPFEKVLLEMELSPIKGAVFCECSRNGCHAPLIACNSGHHDLCKRLWHWLVPLATAREKPGIVYGK